MICKICNQEVKDTSFVNYHLRKVHDVSGKKYYDLFLKEHNEGICQNENCNKKTSYKTITSGYADYCSRACTSRSSKSKEKAKATMRKNYGVEHALQSKYIREKMEKKNIRDKGVKNVFQLDDVKNKIRKTNIEKLGVEYPMQNNDVLQKSIKTNEEKYGTKRPSQNDIVKAKMEATNVKKYGVKSTLQHQETIDKIKLTRKKNYWDKFLLLLKCKKIKYELDKNYFLNNNKRFKYKCLRCDKTFIKDTSNADRIFCTCMKYRSQYEDEIINDIKKYYPGKIVPNKLFIDPNNNRFEIDVYIPDLHLGIDFGGMFWHSNINKEKNYHRDKYLFFEKMNIKLLQVFECEWKNNKDVVNSVIKNNIGNNQKVYARKCNIREIHNKEYRSFLIENHLQNYAPATIKLGLFYNEELISLVSFRNSRYRGKNKYSEFYEYELTRSCTKIGYTVVGGFSRLLKYFENNFKPKNIVSYVDVRYFSGGSYIKNGFTLKNHTKPNYHYFHKNEQLVLYNRMAFQKSKLKNKLNEYNPELTEYENMLNNGYYRIYDAGILTLIKDLNQLK